MVKLPFEVIKEFLRISFLSLLKNDGKNDTIPIVGGPYISYIYNNTNNSILIVGLVNNPGDDKMIYIKQFESIFRDIKNK